MIFGNKQFRLHGSLGDVSVQSVSADPLFDVCLYIVDSFLVEGAANDHSNKAGWTGMQPFREREDF